MIWYHFYNLENLENTHLGVVLLVKLQLYRRFPRFLNCTNATRSRKASHILYINVVFYKIIILQYKARFFLAQLSGKQERKDQSEAKPEGSQTKMARSFNHLCIQNPVKYLRWIVLQKGYSVGYTAKGADFLTKFSPTFHFYTPRKRHKIFGFLAFSGGIEMEHCAEMG